MGDFNYLLRPDNKKRGLHISRKVSNEFSSCLNDCDLIELESKGPIYTWEGKGTTKKLNWAFWIDNCKILYPNSYVDHLVKHNSNHILILVKLHSDFSIPTNHLDSRMLGSWIDVLMVWWQTSGIQIIIFLLLWCTLLIILKIGIKKFLVIFSIGKKN